MVVGTVKWFNTDRGYGFIAPEQGKDVFVHISALAASGLQVLTEASGSSSRPNKTPRDYGRSTCGPPKSPSPPVGRPPGDDRSGTAAGPLGRPGAGPRRTYLRTER
jgi:cold shock protein